MDEEIAERKGEKERRRRVNNKRRRPYKIERYPK